MISDYSITIIATERAARRSRTPYAITDFTIGSSTTHDELAPILLITASAFIAVGL